MVEPVPVLGQDRINPNTAPKATPMASETGVLCNATSRVAPKPTPVAIPTPIEFVIVLPAALFRNFL